MGNKQNSFMVSVFRRACGFRLLTKVTVFKCDDFTRGGVVSVHAVVCVSLLLEA